jgi:cytochrome c
MNAVARGSFVCVITLAVLLASWTLARASNVEHGKEVFKLCEGCHSVTAGETRFGPSLAALVGRPAGRLAGYDFSDALAAAGFKWDRRHLTQWLSDEPKNMVPGTRMEFPGISNPADVASLIDYLSTLE